MKSERKYVSCVISDAVQWPCRRAMFANKPARRNDDGTRTIRGFLLGMTLLLVCSYAFGGSGSPLSTNFDTLNSNQEVYYVDSVLHHVHQLAWTSTTGWHDIDATASAGAPAAAGDSPIASHIDTISNSLEVFYVTSNRHVQQLWWTPSGWGTTDPTQITGALSAAAGSGLSTNINTVTNADEVFYTGSDQHIHELAWRSGVGWITSDPTTVAGAPSAAADSVLASHMNTISNSQEIFYVAASNRHVQQLWWTSSSGWGTTDPTQLTGAASAAAGSGLSTDINTLSNADEVYYMGSDQHIHELAWRNGVGWITSDPTASAGAPSAAWESPITSHMNTIANSLEVFYMGSDNHVHQLWWTSPSWHHTDVNVSAAAPSALPGSGLANNMRSTQADEIYFEASDLHVHEVAWTSSGGWSTSDPTSLSGAPNSETAIENAYLDDQPRANWTYCTNAFCTPHPPCFPATPEFVQGTAVPSLDGGSIETYQGCSSGDPNYFWGILWQYKHTLSSQEQAATNYRAEWNTYVDNTTYTALEFDFPVVVNNQVYYFGSQCKKNGKWQYWDHTAHWVDTTVACTQLTANSWHRIVWYGTRNTTQITYGTLSVDGQAYVLNITASAYTNTGLPNNSITPQFQPDGNGLSAYHQYIDINYAWVW